MTNIENPQYDRATCYFCLCEETEVLEEHHIIPRRFGGGDDDENMVRLCPTCHRKIERLYDSRFYDGLDVTKDDSDNKPGLDADDIETGTSKAQRDRVRNVLDLVESQEDAYPGGVPEDFVIEQSVDRGMDRSKVVEEITKLKQRAEIYESAAGRLRST